MFADEAFAGAFGKEGRPGWSPGRLALVTVLQRVDNLTDRPERTDEPLGGRVRPRRARRRLEDTYARPSEHPVKSSADLAIPVPDQESEPGRSLPQFHQQIARLLRRPDTGRMSRDTKDMHAPRFDLHDKQHAQAFEKHRIDVEKVAHQDAGGLGGEELAPSR
ncbi:hypothetical protein [Nonomuraea sp. NPDC003709]|uniref:hypothetical protein n=1 Tax=Nonomuraea sp. NPDC003709 TaxID=3154450 RepID=UPI0033BD62A8